LPERFAPGSGFERDIRGASEFTMMLLSAAESRELDRLSQSRYGIASYTLMTRAGEAVAEAIRTKWSDRLSAGVLVVAGKGNNGGDGFVAARKLRAEGVATRVLLVGRTDELKGDAARALADYAAAGGLTVEAGDVSLLGADHGGVVIDAIFGTGLNAEVRGTIASVIAALNDRTAPIVAVDIASGVNADTGAILGVAVKAALTVTFGYAKYGHVSYPGVKYCGELAVADIGFASVAIEQIASRGRLIEAAEARAMLPVRSANSHKGTYGHVLIVAGSRGKGGAALLASRGALHAGAGLVTAAIPEAVAGIVAVGQAELMTEPMPDRDGHFDVAPTIARLREIIPGKRALVVGPGLGLSDATVELIAWIIREGVRPECPLLLDADGLNALARLGPGELRAAAGPVVLTPHPGEMARLLGRSTAAVNADRIGAARELATITDASVLLKGARSVTVSGDAVSINSSGNPGMATPGMGDVLGGIVGALMGQGIEAGTALRLGAFVHGRAADRLAAKASFGYLASELAAALPGAFAELA
jgi:NAD(P)H-hydrate epimerase